MVDAWIFAGEPATGGEAPGTTTLLDGTTFCISNAVGDIEAAASHGLFVADTRFVSCWRLRIDGAATAPLSVIESDPSGGSFVSKVRPSAVRPDPAVVVSRDRYVGEGMTELVTVRNLGRDSVSLRLLFEVGADFAHLFEVKEDRVQPRGFHSVEVLDRTMRFDFRDGRRERRLSLSVPEGADAGPGRIAIAIDLAPGSRWSAAFDFAVRVDEVDLPQRHRAGRPGPSQSAANYREWKRGRPSFETGDEGFTVALERSIADLGALRILDEDLDADAVIAAGAPWYMAMFGRDSIIASEMSLLLDPSMATGTLRALARRQGTKVDRETEEQPGRILHEMRFRIDGAADGPSRSAYYGSIDATPLFVGLLGEAVRFGLEESVLAELLPVADRALSWIDAYGDRDGDGFIEYDRMTPSGLVNQGWKDSVDGINFVDGTIATAPIALCEVQGYAYAAFVARAELAALTGDDAAAGRWNERASVLAEAFNHAFFDEATGCYAVALDGSKRRVDSVTSNIGHLLWSGIVDASHARSVADRLVSPELFNGWGVRTLSSEMAAYNPMSYHNGSVWPHDTAIAVAGLVRYGFTAEAATIGTGLIAAAHAFGGRLPELFCGFSSEEFAAPVAYPAACAPQAWASASLISLVRSFAGFEPDLASGMLRLAPSVPSFLGAIEVSALPLGASRLRLRVSGSDAQVEGLPSGVTVRVEPPRPER